MTQRSGEVSHLQTYWKTIHNSTVLVLQLVMSYPTHFPSLLSSTFHTHIVPQFLNLCYECLRYSSNYSQQNKASKENKVFGKELKWKRRPEYSDETIQHNLMTKASLHSDVTTRRLKQDSRKRF